ncbi:MAG: DUF4395 domain-containing protein [Nocardioides sp.]
MNAQPIRAQIDSRSPRFTAALTAVVLAGALWTAPSPLATGLLAIQTILFAWGVLLGVQRTPTAWLFRTWLRPHLERTDHRADHTEDAAPPRFAQGVGLGFGVIGLLAFGTGASIVGLLAVGCALAAAVLNAAFGYCLGCEVYLLGKRLPRLGEASRDPSGVSSPI